MSQQINLFNPIFLKQKKYFSAVAMVQALGVLIAGCALMAVYAQIQVNTLNNDNPVATNFPDHFCRGFYRNIAASLSMARLHCSRSGFYFFA